MGCLAAFLSGFVTSMYAQERAPQLLVDAARCLATESQGWLPEEHGKATELKLGYLIDTKSYVGEQVLYLVDYTGASRSEGIVFTIFVMGQRGRRVFDIQNNARFRRSKDGIRGLDFVDPPLGGTGIQEDLVSAIKQIERHASIRVPIAALKKPSASARCRAYWDRK